MPKKMIWKCAVCGSTEVQTIAWIDPNKHEITTDEPPTDGLRGNWCYGCDGHVELKIEDVEPTEEDRAWAMFIVELEARVQKASEDGSDDDTQEKLDDVVHDAVSQEASDTNNDGIEEQIEYLRAQGWTVKQIKKELNG